MAVMARERPVDDDELEEVAANVGILIRAELEVAHRLDGHPSPVEECPRCAATRMAAPG
jgi:hypothetical protein